ncbi:MAG TPA: hypothetical protein VMW17_11390 [Candidatus Binatia bacterium]|nr:hypothetical protein [Candidatus Binatia bacterium]
MAPFMSAVNCTPSSTANGSLPSMVLGTALVGQIVTAPTIGVDVGWIIVAVGVVVGTAVGS